jgi:hypothetical protein
MYDYGAVFLFVCSCFFVRLMYTVVKNVLSRCKCVNTKYLKLPEYRQMYIQKNITKSAYLLCLVVYALYTILVPICFDNVWNTYQIHRLAVLYVSNDFMGILCVDKLPNSTLIHHVISTVLVFASLSLDFQESDIGQAMFLYTFASATSYLVNLHLGVRLLVHKGDLLYLRYVAALIYVSACFCSWTWHTFWFFSRPVLNQYHILYLMLLGFIVRDDIILIQWLLC